MTESSNQYTYKSSLALVDIFLLGRLACCQQYTCNQKSTLGVGYPPFFAQLLAVGSSQHHLQLQKQWREANTSIQDATNS